MAEAAEECHRRRAASPAAPCGPLSVTGVHGLDDLPEGRLPAIPGRWHPDGDRLAVTATAADGLLLDGRPPTGTARLDVGQGPPERARAGQGRRRFAVSRREGPRALRVHGPESGRFRAAPRTVRRPEDPAARTTGTFTLYPDTRVVRGADADGHHRGRGPGGEPAFTPGGRACPFPPPGNSLAVPVRAGERNLVEG
ncbi:hypothetical protein OH717_04900 [Streptomyces albidoflavus]|nr:hypothetical protein OH717_04900 [Streptomyces albidoflavus]